MKTDYQASAIRLAIVDPAPQDYGDVLSSAGVPGVSVHFLVSGNDAIRFAKRLQAGIWVINSRLCDMSGFDLAEMLRSIRPSALIFMIGDQYNLDDELQTLTLGLARYFCKPLEPSWILPHRDSCIPMRAFRTNWPSLRVVSASSREHQNDHLASMQSEEANRASGDILPFDRGQGRRPAA